MSAFVPPLRDIEFVVRDLAGLSGVNNLAPYAEATPEMVSHILEEAGRIAESLLAPLNQAGDKQGARIENGKVRTADGWIEAYRTIVGGNWIGLSCNPEFGGMGLPELISAAVNEMWQGANMAFGLCSMLTQGAINAIHACGSEEQMAAYLPSLVSGTWTGTMNLTEAGAGSDLGAIRTKAVRKSKHYLISGQKIFITYGDHDMAENIIHLVLARTPDAPPGVKGISLFIVPKFLTDAEGRFNIRNDVHCMSIEHKLGVHASPTCVMSFGDQDGAVGYLVGEENRGLEYMFVMMNHARLIVGLQGLGIAERAYQQALGYARERVQGKPPAATEGSITSDATIVDHPDVRRMLMVMKSQIEAMRALAYITAAALDHAHAGLDTKSRDRAKLRAEFLTPIVKGFCTERGQEIASIGVQIHGGMGYIEETGACQHLRDGRLTSIYEGTTAIQANDLVNRKILRDRGETAAMMLDEAEAEAGRLIGHRNAMLADLGRSLSEGVNAARMAVHWILNDTKQDPRLPAGAAVPLLMLLGTVLCGHQMARAATIAEERGGQDDDGFYETKLKTAWFYGENILPQAGGFLAAITRGTRTIMALSSDRL